MKKVKQNKAITLISLVVTITVLIILAGVSISLILGENGIITKAKETKQVSKDDIERENKFYEDFESLLDEYNIGNINDKENIKIIKISNAIKGKNKTDLVGYEEYVGDFIKIGNETLKSLNLDYTGEYYINIKTGEIYDFEGEEKDGIKYHTIEQYNQILKSKNLNRTKNLMEINNMHIQTINNSQYNTGAYASYSKSSSKESKVVPYFNCVGMLGLIEDIPSLVGVKNYIKWHFNHINDIDVDGNVGTIYDYYVMPDGTESYKTESLYDSIDSYSALFFIVLDEYYNKTGDIKIFEDNIEKFKKVEQSLNDMFLYNNTGTNLTLTKPQYKVYYLMDNCESYAGYVSLANLYEKVYKDNAKAELYKQRAELLKTAIEEKLYVNNESHPEFSNYDYAYKNSSYNGLFFDKEYYPYVLAQIYPVLYKVVDIDTEKSQHLYFLHQYYSNTEEEGTGLWYTFKHKGSTYPHFESLYVALMYNNNNFNTRVNNYNINVDYEIEQAISNICDDFNNKKNQYPWTVAERAYIIRSLNMYMNKYK